MSLLSVTVKKARFVGAQAAQWNCYATLKLQHVKSTTVTVKGATPSWEQDFLFEINNLDTGLLVEVWNKGLIWDKAVGYHWLHLRDIHYSNFAGAGQWLSLEAEQVMRDGEVIGTKTPTGHVLLVDARFELPLGAVEGDEALELQRKLEILNSMLDKEARAEHSRRQHQYYIQCESGVSEDSDYTSDVNFPVGQHPNSSASQFLTAANQLATPQRSLNSSRENSYEKEDEYRVGGIPPNHNSASTDPSYMHPHQPSYPARTTPRRLPQPQTQPRPPQQQQGYWDEGLPQKTGMRDSETEPLYYNSRPQTQNYKSYGSYRRRDVANDEYGYREDLPYTRRQYSDNYDNAQEIYPQVGSYNYSKRLKNNRREMPSLERQDTLYSETGDYTMNDGSLSYANTTSSNSQQQHQQFPSSQVQVHTAQQHQENYNSTQLNNSTIAEVYNQSTQQYGSSEYGPNGHAGMYDTVDTAAPPKQSVHIPGIQKNYSYDEWNHVDDSRDQQQYNNSNVISAAITSKQHYKSTEYNKTGFQKSKSVETPHIVPSVIPTAAVPDHYYPASQYPAISQDESMYDANEETSYYDDQGKYSSTAVTGSLIPFTYEQQLPANQNQQSQDYVDEIGYENWDYTTGYYDESGNFIPFESDGQSYYDASGNLIVVPNGDGDQTQYDEYYQQDYDNTAMDYYWTETGEDQQQYYEDETGQTYNPSLNIINKVEMPTSKSKPTTLQSQPSVEYNYAYQSVENLSPVDKSKKPLAGVTTGVTVPGVERMNSLSKRASFRRQTSTRDYGLEGEPQQHQQKQKEITNQNISAYQQPNSLKNNNKISSMDMGYSLEDEGHYTGSEWKSQSQEYTDAEEGTHRTDSYDQYEDAQMHHNHSQSADSGQNEGPVHMDSLDSNTSDPGASRDPEANEKFEAQYWQKQRERIASQTTLLSQASEEFYNYEPTYPTNDTISDQNQNLNLLKPGGPLSPPLIVPQPGQGLMETLAKVARSRQGSLEEQWPDEAEDVWLDSRHGSIKSRKDVPVINRQETLESHPEEDAEYLIGDEDGQIPIRVRKQSTLSVDSQGEPLPPTTPPPGGSTTKTSSMDDETMDQRKSSLDIPGKDKGKTVSFDDEPPKVCPERQTKGMTSKEKWLWSMNRICSQLQVSHEYLIYS